MNEHIDLSGKTALVTGAGRGIGAAIARRLAKAGARVVVTSRSEGAIAQLAAGIRAAAGAAHSLVCDVSLYSDVAAAVRFCVDTHGSLDILVNNAGVIEPIAPLADSDPELWSAAVDINLKGVYFGMRAAIPVMEAQGGGTIITLSSGAADSALEGWSHYCSTKSAVKKLTECAHKEAGGRGVRVVGLSPGTVATDMMARIRDSGINPVSQLAWSSHIPPEWAAEAVAFLCTKAADPFLGTDFSIKTREGRALVGLVDMHAG